MNKKVPTKTFYHSKFHAPENFKEYPKKEHDMTDFKERKFKTYNEYTTGTGYNLSSLEDAFEFNNIHEGLHFGFMMNIRKFI